MTQELFTHIYDTHFHELFNYAKQITSSRMEAEDACADVFEKFWRTDLSSVHDIKRWLYKCVKNRCIDQSRSSYTRKMISLQDHMEMLTEYDERLIGQAEMKAEYVRQLKVRMQKLPPQCRQICEMAYFEGLSIEEISVRLSISIQTVKNQKWSGMLRLREQLVIFWFVSCVSKYLIR